MTPQEALQILDQIAASVTGLNRQSHLAAMEATQVLKKVVADLNRDGDKTPLKEPAEEATS